MKRKKTSSSKHQKPKRPKPYALSEESKKSALEFAYAAKTASKLLFLLKAFVAVGRGRGVFNRLSAQILKIVQTGPEADKGKRMLADGNTDLLLGFQLNPYKPLDSLIYVFPTIELSLASSTVHIKLPELNPDFFRIPKKAIGVCLNFMVSILPLTEELPPSPLVSEDLELLFSSGSFPAKAIRFPLASCPAYLLLVSMRVRFRIGEADTNLYGSPETTASSFLSGNRLHYAAAVLASTLVIDGQIQQNQSAISPRPKPTRQVFPDVTSPKIKWDD